MAESWAVYDNSQLSPQLQGKEGMKSPIRPRRPESFRLGFFGMILTWLDPGAPFYRALRNYERSTRRNALRQR
jgi:hypothetical protein